MSQTNSDTGAQNLSERLIRAAGRLAEVMEGEVELLEALRTKDIEAQLPDKRAAARDYRDLLGRLAGQTEKLGALDSGTKARLRAAAERLAAATQANARALTAGIEANGRLVRAIALAVHEEQLPGGRYSANGRMGETLSADQPLAVSVNQVL